MNTNDATGPFVRCRRSRLSARRTWEINRFAAVALSMASEESVVLKTVKTSANVRP